ncbi:MAG TPA: DUF4870 domain-containing protein [Vicinamibacterales bacterium]
MNVAEKSSTGLDANVAAALSYLLGLITGIVFYAIEKDSRFVKFHAMQSILVSLGVIVVWVVYGVLANVLAWIPILGWIALALLWAVIAIGALVLWIVLMLKAFQGERFKLPWFGDMAERQMGA